MRVFLQRATVVFVLAGVIVALAFMLVSPSIALTATIPLEDRCKLPPDREILRPQRLKCPLILGKRCIGEKLIPIPKQDGTTTGYLGVKADTGKRAVESLVGVVEELKRRVKAHDGKTADPRKKIGAWIVTEGHPPFKQHDSPCHKLGCALDIALRGYVTQDPATGKKTRIEKWENARVNEFWNLIVGLYKEGEFCFALNEAWDLANPKLCPELSAKAREKIEAAEPHFHIERWGTGKKKCSEK